MASVSICAIAGRQRLRQQCWRAGCFDTQARFCRRGVPHGKSDGQHACSHSRPGRTSVSMPISCSDKTSDVK
jgi:hypothetical protein